MENKKESVLRILDTAKSRCAQAVLEGDLTVEEYEIATGKDGSKLMEQVISAVKTNYALAGAALRNQGREAAQIAYGRLLAAGAGEETIQDILGSVTVEEGQVTAPDWTTLMEEQSEGEEPPETADEE